MKLFNLTDKVALITGGNGGIGFAMAKAIGEAGATVVIAGRNEDKNKKKLWYYQKCVKFTTPLFIKGSFL